MAMLRDIQDQCVSLMKGDKYYARVEVQPIHSKVLRNRITVALAKVGIAAIVHPATAENGGSESPGPRFDNVLIDVDIWELVAKNRGDQGSKLSCDDVAEHTAWLLHSANHAHERTDDYLLICRGMREINNKTYLVYKVRFSTTGMLDGIVDS